MDQKTTPQRPTRRTKPFIALCLIVAGASIAYRILVLQQLEQTSLMFIGLPTLLAISIALAPTARTITGSIMKGISLFLALLGILFIEGFICILMAAPLFYAVGLIIGIFADQKRVRRDLSRYRLVIFPTLFLMSLEGVNELFSFPRQETVTITHLAPYPLEETKTRLASAPDFDLTKLPPFLKLGFPTPQSIAGEGLDLNDTWRIKFAGGEGQPGELLAKVVENNDQLIRVVCIRDNSHIAHWLEWQQAKWQLRETTQGTHINLTISYRRLLDPAWYFKPIERYGVRQAGEYLIEQTLATE